MNPAKLLNPRDPGAANPRAARVAAALYAYCALDELVLLYPLYALLFADSGLSVAQIASLFAIWSVTGLLLEVPSGVWADAVSRRLLLVLGPLLTAAGFALWLLFPSYPAFALGFVLWGAGGALQSGALEALVYEELDRVGAADRYARVMGRARAAGIVAVAVATAAAIPVYAAGGFAWVGAASVAACLLCSLAAAALPEHRGGPAAPYGSGGDDGAEEERGYLATLRDGLREVRRDRSVRGAVLLSALVYGVWGALDEFVPLLAADTEVPTSMVPVLILVIWCGVTVGGLLAGAGERLTDRGLAALLAAGGAAMAAGAVSGSPLGILGVAAAFGAFQLATVVADARLQARITGSSRATVTSLAGLGTELTTLAVYAGYGAASAAAGHGMLFAVFALAYPLMAVVLARGRRARRAARTG
ncbi:MFS transporter [Allonocardiopsis opalescens]|uniref:Putative MFS family arabinose efflux permease n=1 Tax=Allonocardiopsis opalescens TaxID=1144618 RepID=A0A2T0Q5H4_9ACTN|nr:MFS transporter [Allonocardiopsis opalescens]PRX99020.1 putative MFS family arabinose efflux permease [Allonocardiopsis opalescens]